MGQVLNSLTAVFSIGFFILAVACGSQPDTSSTPRSTPIESITSQVDKCSDPSKQVITRPELLELNLTFNELKDVQFWTSGNLTFKRKVLEAKREVVKHRIAVTDGITYEMIDIPCLTAGVLIDAAPDMHRQPFHTLRVQFESGGDGVPFLPYPEGYKLERNDSVWLIDYGRVRYDLYGSSLLLVDREKFRHEKEKKRTLPGVRLDEAPKP